MKVFVGVTDDEWSRIGPRRRCKAIGYDWQSRHKNGGQAAPEADKPATRAADKLLNREVPFCE